MSKEIMLLLWMLTHILPYIMSQSQLGQNLHLNSYEHFHWKLSLSIDHFCLCLSCSRYEGTLWQGQSRKFPLRKNPWPVRLKPTTLSLALLNSCAFTAKAIWAPCWFICSYEHLWVRRKGYFVINSKNLNFERKNVFILLIKLFFCNSTSKFVPEICLLEHGRMKLLTRMFVSRDKTDLRQF